MSTRIHSSELFKPTGRISAIPLDPRFGAIWENYKVQEGSFWTAEKIDFKSKDRNVFPTLPEDIQTSILKILGYFAASDEIVEEIIKESVISRVTIPEIRYIYAFEAMMENVHSTTYNNAIENYCFESKERDAIFRSVEHTPVVAKKAAWARKWCNPNKSYPYVLLGKACVEGINFSGSFAFIDWLKTQKYELIGLFESNDEISRDEHRHCHTSKLVYDQISDVVPREEAREIINEALAIEYEFMQEVIPSRGYLGMNQSMMNEHLKHCASLVANAMGYDDLFSNTYCPFSFMNLRNFDTKTNMFEKASVDYSTAVKTGLEYDKILEVDAVI
jgi:ribonucleoside-diphosphate reductase subunit M2